MKIGITQSSNDNCFHTQKLFPTGLRSFNAFENLCLSSFWGWRNKYQLNTRINIINLSFLSNLMDFCYNLEPIFLYKLQFICWGFLYLIYTHVLYVYMDFTTLGTLFGCWKAFLNGSEEMIKEIYFGETQRKENKNMREICVHVEFWITFLKRRKWSKQTC